MFCIYMLAIFQILKGLSKSSDQALCSLHRMNEIRNEEVIEAVKPHSNGSQAPEGFTPVGSFRSLPRAADPFA